MSASPPPAPGSIRWVDLTIPDAPAIRDFYAAVTGWVPQDVDMGGYADYNMTEPESRRPAAGICHARGGNTGLPPQWLVYITVRDLDASLARCRTLGGTVVVQRRGSAEFGWYAVIQDPAGAVAALFQPGPIPGPSDENAG